MADSLYIAQDNNPKRTARERDIWLIEESIDALKCSSAQLINTILNSKQLFAINVKNFQGEPQPWTIWDTCQESVRQIALTIMVLSN